MPSRDRCSSLADCAGSWMDWETGCWFTKSMICIEQRDSRSIF